jgi:preprotein translocase subunit SecA
MTVECIDNYQPSSEGRKKAYDADITYGTNNEFGFDLRDNMALRRRFSSEKTCHCR